MPGTYAVATTSSANSSVVPLAANLLFTSPGNATYNVTGTQYPGLTTVSDTYNLTTIGTGTITPPSGTTASAYAIYAIGTLDCTGNGTKNLNPACAVTSFVMIDEDTTNTTPSVIFAQE
jgi:hypothetical protein